MTDTKRAYSDLMTAGYVRPTVLHRTSLEDLEKYGNRILRKGFLTAIVKSYTDWSEPKWKIGDGKTKLKDLPYCSGPPSVVIEGGFGTSALLPETEPEE